MSEPYDTERAETEMRRPILRARYAVTIYQSNCRENRVSVEVVAGDAAEARRKALALAQRIHSPIVRISTVTELPAAPVAAPVRQTNGEEKR